MFIITLSKLTSGDGLQIIGDLFGTDLNSTLIIVKKRCLAIKIHLRPLVFKKPTLVRMK